MLEKLGKGALFGLGIGYAVADGLGSLIGAGAGYAVDKFNNQNVDNQFDSYSCFLGMMIGMAKIDGKFDDDEKELILKRLKDCYYQEKELYHFLCEAYENIINEENINIITLARQYDSHIEYEIEDREFIYEILFEIACIDNELSKNEIEVLQKLPKYLGLEETIYERFEKKYKPKPLTTECIEDLIGLNTVKDNIKTIINSIKIEKLRGGKVYPGHYIFQGNPGTGKTTVARILGNKFKELELLTKGHFLEVKREDLVGEYQGHTAVKTKEILNKALGGILFIDEVYSLKNGERDDFGMEAINTIVPFIEDNRQNMIVVIAGYSQPMNEFLSTNPGLKSRFNTTIDFEDYNTDELYEIFKGVSKDFNWNETTTKKIKDYLSNMIMNKDENFGNARDVRKFFENIKKHQINRLVEYSDLVDNDSRLYEFIVNDIK